MVTEKCKGDLGMPFISDTKLAPTFARVLGIESLELLEVFV